MLNQVIINALKNYDDEITAVEINDSKVSIFYSDDDIRTTSDIRIEESDLILDFDVFTITIHLSVEA